MLRMIGVILVFCVVLMPLSASADGIEVKIETGFAQAILSEVCSDQAVDEVSLRRSVAVQDMLTHFVRFRPDFTIENYIAARKAAAQCQTHGKDIFRFAEVIARRDELRREISTTVDMQSDYSARASDMVRQLSPGDIAYDGAAVLMVGTPSCGGWSAGQAFYLDIPCLKDDREGMLFLIAHEIYHGIQEQFMGQLDEGASSIAELFYTIIREGSALNIADFSKIDTPGNYARQNQDVIKTNRRRMLENFGLLEIMTTYLSQETGADAFDTVYNIGASGLFDSPLYAIGDEMTSQLREHYGAEATVCIMRLPPNYFFVAYQSAVAGAGIDTEAITLPDNVIEAAKDAEFEPKRLDDCLHS
jgi:hypothetical protein